jgi:hypothetical protein
VPPPYKRVTHAILAATLLVAVSTCGDDPTVARIPVRVELMPATDTVYVGEIATVLSASAFNARDDVIQDAVITWRSDQPFVAEVDSLTGSITGIRPGVAAVTAQVGSVADTADIVVLNALRVSLPLDTILLAPGDTFSLPVEVLVATGEVPPAVTFGGGAPGIASIDPASGLVTALGAGVAPFVAQADTVVVGGGIVVLALGDTAFGFAYFALSGAVDIRVALDARAFNHPTTDGRTVFQVAARTPDVVHEMAVVLIDSLVGPGTRAVGTMPPSGIGAGTDPVCRPTESFVFYRRTLLTQDVWLSQAGGHVTVTTDGPLLDARRISGRFDVELQRTDLAGEAGRIRARGTFVLPLVTLTACPQ